MQYILTILFSLLTLSLSAQNLTRAQAEQEARTLATQWIADTKEIYQQAWETHRLVIGSEIMSFWYTTYGTKPADGYSLFISLHGGGNAPAQLNDSQWENQKQLYQPQNSVYLAPRAPYDDWDMWFKPDLDQFYASLIQMCVAYLDVNPDKVYLIGYSAGGDGVWRMAPRMADTWAGASMMAGHPGDVSLLNLRNTPFMVWCGALDAAYNRNRECTQRGIELDSLHTADPNGYLHETHIVEGKPHWMDLEDAAALPWLQQYQRNPYPTQIVWRQEEVTHPHFYWLTVPEDQLQRGKTVRLSLKGNTVNISQCDYTQLTLHFNDQMVKLDKPVIIKYKGKTIFKGKLPRTLANLQSSLAERNDLRYMFPAQVTIQCR
ncbi:MAG: alpha/beta hydrolase [Bacteroidaceae bacterium]|nr:alpha/beta hydrolase [Bacteroidaceae bacterium]